MISWYTYGHLDIELCHIFVKTLVVIQAGYESSQLTRNRMELHKNRRILQRHKPNEHDLKTKSASVAYAAQCVQ
jgi:hypothetical protein